MLNPVGEGSMILRNVGIHLQDFTQSQTVAAVNTRKNILRLYTLDQETN